MRAALWKHDGVRGRDTTVACMPGSDSVTVHCIHYTVGFVNCSIARLHAWWCSKGSRMILVAARMHACMAMDRPPPFLLHCKSATAMQQHGKNAEFEADAKNSGNMLPAAAADA
jgi:hypothetical protein